MAADLSFEISLTLEYLDDEIAVYGPELYPQLTITRSEYDALGRPGRLTGKIMAGVA